MAGPLYGTGATWMKMLPWIHPTEDAKGQDHGQNNQTSDGTEEGMQAPLYSGKPSKGTKLTAGSDGHGPHTIV